ncbi:MAG TPA: FimV/HubP family polar landmark protein [Rhodanobacteraceae bacterium]|nr:FimV/HubP family polar landmark protein [Rhodanobacteraceae bacterium]
MATPVLALQLGQIQVKSALNQPLVAAIPLHPKSLTELEGMTVTLAPAADFARAGLQMTAASQTLQFRVVTDNNGQKSILVTSSQPITDPYLDFLVQVNTRHGKQVREFVVLLNPVISAPAPVIEAAPTTAAPAASAQPAQLPAASAFPQPAPAPVSAPPTPAPAPAPLPEAQPAPQPAAQAPEPVPQPVAQPQAAPAPQAQPNAPSGSINVVRGDTLYHLAAQATANTGESINQMMLAMQAANPDAFYKDNINNLKAGAILRIPTRDEVDARSVAAATAEVRRQMESWTAAKPQAATVLAGTAVQAAANSETQPGAAAPASDHLSLVPPSGEGGSANNRPGVEGGTGSETVAGMRQKLQNARSSLVSLSQSNADLDSRVKSLKDIADKSDKLLSLKDATVADLQRKLAQVQAGKAGAATGASTAPAAGASVATAASVAGTSAAVTSAPAASASASAKAPPASAKPAAKPAAQPWYMRPLAWIVAGVVIVVLILLGLLLRRRKPGVAAHGPLPDPEDVGSASAEPAAAPRAPDERVLHARLVENPGDLDAHLQLCRLYYSRADATHFVEEAEAMREEVTDLGCVEWREVLVMGGALAPHHPLFAAHAEPADDPYGLTALRRPVAEAAPPMPAEVEDDATVVRPAAPEYDAPSFDAPDAAAPVAPPAPARKPSTVPPPAVSHGISAESAFSDDPVDTKLDLARAYLDMGDPVGARAMLEEVLAEGTQTQKDEARKLLAEAGAPN